MSLITSSSLQTEIGFSVVLSVCFICLVCVKHCATLSCVDPVNHLFLRGSLRLLRVINKPFYILGQTLHANNLNMGSFFFDLRFILVIGLNGLILKAFGLSKAVGKLIYSFKRAHILFIYPS